MENNSVNLLGLAWPIEDLLAAAYLTAVLIFNVILIALVALVFRLYQYVTRRIPNADDSRIAEPGSSLAMENPSCSQRELSLSKTRQEKPLDTFTGTQAELKDWLHHFDIVAELNG